MTTLHARKCGLWVTVFFALVTAFDVAAKTEVAQLETLVGQMVLVGFKGTTPNDLGVQQVAQAISEGKLGGVILYKHNIESPAQLKLLCDYLHGLRREPLLIAVDQEGGKVQRLKASNGFTDYPSHQHIGEKGYSFEEAYQVYRELALELKRYGINLNFAPVVDLRLNPGSRIIAQYERSFSSDPFITAQYARAFIKAHRDAGVLTTVKHWPGHGSAAEDSHLEMVDVTATWQRDEQLPYELLIREGDVDAVMTAHVFHRGFDKHYPATLSRPIIEGRLREDLGFDGVVFTDCLQMGAIKSLVEGGTEEAALKAIWAGADIMLVSNFDTDDSDFMGRLVSKIEQTREGSESLLDRLNESNRRILKLKKRLLVAGGHDDL